MASEDLHSPTIEGQKYKVRFNSNSIFEFLASFVHNVVLRKIADKALYLRSPIISWIQADINPLYEGWDLKYSSLSRISFINGQFHMNMTYYHSRRVTKKTRAYAGGSSGHIPELANNLKRIWKLWKFFNLSTPSKKFSGAQAP